MVAVSSAAESSTVGWMSLLKRTSTMSTEVYTLIKRKSKLLIMALVVVFSLLALTSAELKLELAIEKIGFNLKVETRH
jgi:fluoride ion exporter CrcB/FEX